MLNEKNMRAFEGMSEGEKAELREKMAFADQTDPRNIFFVYMRTNCMRKMGRN
jgi:ACS family allantoate permease-like MFS transporter